MKSKDQVQLEEAYQSVNEAISSRRAKGIDAMHFKNNQEEPFKFNDANTFHSDEGYDTGPEDVPQPTKSSSKKTYYPATVRVFKQLMAMIEDHVDDIPPELLDKVVARLQKAKQAWGSDIQHSDQEAYQDAAGGARTSKYKTVQPGMGKR